MNAAKYPIWQQSVEAGVPDRAPVSREKAGQLRVLITLDVFHGGEGKGFHLAEGGRDAAFAPWNIVPC